MRSRGFTLIELLVVIAIIAVLAAILFPVFTGAKARGIQSACLNNTKQIGRAVDLYATDNNDRMPLCAGFGRWWGVYRTIRRDGKEMWMPELLSPYIKSKRGVFICPAVRDSEKWTQFNVSIPGNGEVSYIFNAMYVDTKTGYPNQTDPISGRPRGKAIRLTIAPVAWDMPYWGKKTARHSGGVNVVYADGHSGWSACGPGYEDWWTVHSRDGWVRGTRP